VSSTSRPQTASYDHQRSHISQAAGIRQPGGVAPEARAAIAALCALALLVAGVVLAAWRPASGGSTSVAVLADGHLVGNRSPAPVAVVLILDDSGSFQAYTAMRHMALAQVIAWMPTNLRADDTLTVVTFSSTAWVTVPTTTVADLAVNPPAIVDGSGGGGTLIQPALALAASKVPSGMTASLVVVTDTAISDADAAPINALIKHANVATMSVITPKGVQVESAWQSIFGWEAEFQAAPDQSDQIAVAVGQALAHATGQRLERS